jgi:class 3 adenylate cyclase
MFDCDYVEVTFLTHDKFYSIATHTSLSVDALQAINSIKTPVSFYESCSNTMSSRPVEPWLCCLERGLAFCNYVAYTGRTFTLHDVYSDESFAWAREAKACQFYSASPIFVRGCNIASLCLCDFRRPRPDFTTAHQIQLEQLAAIATEHLEHWVLRLEMKARGMEDDNNMNDRRRSVSTLNSKAGTFISEYETFQENESYDLFEKQQPISPNPELFCDPPEKDAAVIFTDVQGSTSLWEFNPSAMQKALRLHDQIIRQTIANHRGYEIKTEGDSFQLVFHECHDAVLFALIVQQALYSAPWSQEILSHPDACEDIENGLRGLRVRMAIHFGPVSCHLNEVSCRRDYTGITMNIAKSLENMAYGGQILVTSDVWNRTCHLSQTVLRSPQVLDLGVHILLTGSKKNEGIIEKCVLQLVPRTLAFDYTFHRTASQDRGSQKHDDDFTTDSSGSRGRQFPKLPCLRRLSASFQDAPCKGNMVTILFLAAKNVEELYDDSALILSAMAKHISIILRQFPKAYQCKDLMVAFLCPSDAICCGLAIQDHFRGNNTVAGVSLKNMIKIGLHHGPFTSMGPDLTTGRADYFGVVVNRAARIAEAAHPGAVVMGVLASADCEEPPPLDNGLKATFVGRKALKGINEEMDLYNCFLDRRVMKRTSSIRSSRRLLAL